MEFLVTMTTRVPDSMPADAVERVRAREAARSRELAAQGKLLRLWRPPLRPGEWRTLGLFAADDNGELEQLLASMPPRSWRTDDVTPLGAHPNDPVGQGITIAPGKGPEFLIATTIMVPPGTPAQVPRPSPTTTTTTAPPSTTTTTEPPVTTTSTIPTIPTTTTTVKMTTEWLHVPFLPVPIPVPIPQNPGAGEPQNPFGSLGSG